MPACGMLVGISRKEPSFRLGMNSCPTPRQVKNPQTTVATGIIINFQRLARHQRRMRS